MSNWDLIVNHPSFDKIKTLYNEHFPLEVRMLCARWIENRKQSNRLDDIRKYSDPQQIRIATEFMNDFMKTLNQEKLKLNNSTEIVIMCRIDDAIHAFRHQINSPVEFYRHIYDVLTCEQHYLETYPNSNQNEQHKLCVKLLELRQMVESIGDCKENYKRELEKYTLLLHNISVLPHETREIMEKVKLYQTKIVANLRVVIKTLENTQIPIKMELMKWQRDQLFDGCGASSVINKLNEIQNWLEELVDLIFRMKSIIDELCRATSIGDQNTWKEFSDIISPRIKSVLHKLVASAFIVEQQPPQVLKTGTQ